MPRSFDYAAAVFPFLLTGASALAGPLFDDYLNYVRPGPGTGPGRLSVEARADRPIGQTFRVAPGTGEIYRIGLRPLYPTWGEGERVTVTLYDSSERTKKLASYTIDAATSLIAKVYVPDEIRGRQQPHEKDDRLLYFHLRCPTESRSEFYFEVSTTGGDGAVSFKACDTDALPDGRSIGTPDEVKDLSFECHIKPIADREANLRAFFTQRINLDHPPLAKVKEAVEAGDWERAIALTGEHFHKREDLYASWREISAVERERTPGVDVADLLMKGMLRHTESKQPIPWRTESYWTPEYPTERAQASHSFEPNTYTWHVDRTLGLAYVVTGKPEYARRAIDLRMQFILDNPNPKIAHVPWHFELWNDRTSAARAPGFATLVYTRLYNYPGWTPDERLVFFAFLEDNARWVYRAQSGANWGAEAARGCYEFGVTFPEWRMSPEYISWGTSRLAEIVLEDVRGDGTSTEAAIKYHAMVARRLRGMLEDGRSGKIQLEPKLRERLLRTVEGMYTHMAHMLQPNNYVVMGGDSFYENYAYPAAIGRSDLKDPVRLLTRLREGSDPSSAWLREQFETDARDRLAAYDGQPPPPDELVGIVLAELGRVLDPPQNADSGKQPESFYAPERFVHVQLSPVVRRLLEVRPTSLTIGHLNRLLFDEVFADCVHPAWRNGELHAAAELLDRPDFTWVASYGRAGTPPRETSTLFPDAGYFLMRSDFGASGDYLDSRQLTIHNGGWYGSHGHWDLLGVTLYAYGRPLVIDPGQYEHTPPPGIDKYFESKIHSTLVIDGRNMAREPGTNEWSSTGVADFFQGTHRGYRRVEVRRRVVFVRPDYFVVEDDAAPERMGDWMQVWNLSDPEARLVEGSNDIHTTFRSGGNVLIRSRDGGNLRVEVAPGIANMPGAENRATRIFRLHRQTDRPRFATVLMPYDGPKPPEPHVTWDDATGDSAGRATRVSVRRGASTDQIFLAQGGRPAEFADGVAVDADLACVTAGAFSWMHGRRLVLGGRTLARADAPVHTLAVRRSGSRLIVDAREADPSLAIHAAGATSYVLNGEPVSRPIVREGYFYPFGELPPTVTSDDRDGFERITETDEWTRIPNPAGWSGGYTQHETDPGRHETGTLSLNIPARGRYAVEVHVPAATVPPSDRVAYRFAAEGVPAQPGDGLLSSSCQAGAAEAVIDQRVARGWVRLGEYELSAGELKVQVRNETETDALYLIVDAVRAVRVE